MCSDSAGLSKAATAAFAWGVMCFSAGWEITRWPRRGRGTAGGLAGLSVDLSGLTNLHRMANTPYPRDFYRVGWVLLTPSLWRESVGRVGCQIPTVCRASGTRVLRDSK
jgi:hypothetical protein